MSQVTYPKFSNMQPVAEDLQLIVDSLRTENRNSITKDGVFNPGITGKKADYLSAGSRENSLKIKPFIAYTKNGNRIEVNSTWDNLYPTGTIIPTTTDNLVNEYINIPYWHDFVVSHTNLNAASTTQRYELADLGKGSILHGIKVRTTTTFVASTSSNIWVSIGTSEEPEKFLPETLVSDSNSPTNLSVMNLMYSMDDDNVTKIYLTFRSDNTNLNNVINGSLRIDLCIADLKGFDNSGLNQVDGGSTLDVNTDLTNTTGQWQASTLYYIVARYKEDEGDFRTLSYTDSNGNIITTPKSAARLTTNYTLLALRKTGPSLDASTLDDVKLGEVLTDENSNVYAININGTNPTTNEEYTQYLTIPGYRWATEIDASQIADGSVSNAEFQYLNNLTGNIQTQLNTKAGLNIDNIFKGSNTFETQIKGSIDKVNGFTAYATPTANCLLVLDQNGKIPASSLSENTIASIGNLYTVSSGVTTNGRSSFLIPNTDNDGVVIQASEANPLIINYPDGSAEKISSNITLSSLSADGLYYLVKEKNGDFVFLPTAGGTKACIANAGTNGQFAYMKADSSIAYGTVSKTFQLLDPTDAYLACDGNIKTGSIIGSALYKNYTGMPATEDKFSGLPAGGADTSIIITFPEAITLTSFSACFRQNQDDLTPKFWRLEGTNDDPFDNNTPPVYTTLTESSSSTWNIGEIKTFSSAITDAFKYFRLTTTITETTTNNYMTDETTTAQGYTMYMRCYYLQIFANNTSSVGNKITEGYVQPSSPSIGDYFLDISKKPYKGYKCTGSGTFSEQQYTKLGLVNLAGVSIDDPVVSALPFCYNTFSISNINTVRYWDTSLDPAAWAYSEAVILNRTLIFDHNLGLIPNIVNVRFQCLSANNGYAAGDTIDNIYASDSIGLNSIKDSINTDLTVITLHCGIGAQHLYVKNKTTGVLGITTDNQWKVIIYCSRGW